MSSAPSRKRAIRWKRWRRASQAAFALFFILLPSANRLGRSDVLGNLVSLQVGPVHLVDPAAGLSSVAAARSFDRSLLTGMALPFLLALLLGPVFCSWVCPWGFLSEGIDTLLRRTRIDESATRKESLRRLRWTVLASAILLSAGLGAPLAATFSAPGAITRLPFEAIFLGAVSSGTAALIGLLLGLEIALPRRTWCRILCPSGSLLVLLRTKWTLHIRWNRRTCVFGPAFCARKCPWNLDPRSMRKYDGCTRCGDCIDVCPSLPERSLRYEKGEEQRPVRPTA